MGSSSRYPYCSLVNKRRAFSCALLSDALTLFLKKLKKIFNVLKCVQTCIKNKNKCVCTEHSCRAVLGNDTAKGQQEKNKFTRTDLSRWACPYNSNGLGSKELASKHSYRNDLHRSHRRFSFCLPSSR